jgi:hypothetical protein
MLFLIFSYTFLNSNTSEQLAFKWKKNNQDLETYRKNIEKKQFHISLCSKMRFLFWSTGPKGHWLDKTTQRLHKKRSDLRFWQLCINEIALKLKLIIYNFFVVPALCRTLWSEFSIWASRQSHLYIAAKSVDLNVSYVIFA